MVSTFLYGNNLYVYYRRVTTMSDKPRLVDVMQPEAGQILSANLSLGTPYIYASMSDTFEGKLVSVRVDADELRAWRAHHTSDGGT